MRSELYGKLRYLTNAEKILTDSIESRNYEGIFSSNRSGGDLIIEGVSEETKFRVMEYLLKEVKGEITNLEKELRELLNH
jgi:hypothetical protein